MIKIDCNLIYERIEKNEGSLDFWIKVCLWKCFCDFRDYLHVFGFFFFNNKTKIKLSEQKVKA